MAKLPNQNLHGPQLTQGTVIVLSLTTIILAFLTYLSIKMGEIAPALVGVGLFVIGILVCLPNIINTIKGKIKEHRILTGKEKPEQRKSYNPQHRFDD